MAVTSFQVADPRKLLDRGWQLGKARANAQFGSCSVQRLRPLPRVTSKHGVLALAKFDQPSAPSAAEVNIDLCGNTTAWLSRGVPALHKTPIPTAQVALLGSEFGWVDVLRRRNKSRDVVAPAFWHYLCLVTITATEHERPNTRHIPGREIIAYSG